MSQLNDGKVGDTIPSHLVVRKRWIEGVLDILETLKSTNGHAARLFDSAQESVFDCRIRNGVLHGEEVETRQNMMTYP